MRQFLSHVQLSNLVNCLALDCLLTSSRYTRHYVMYTVHYSGEVAYFLTRKFQFPAKMVQHFKTLWTHIDLGQEFLLNAIFSLIFNTFNLLSYLSIYLFYYLFSDDVLTPISPVHAIVLVELRPPPLDLYRPPTNQECITFHSPNRIGVVCKPIRKLICKNNCVTSCQIQNHGETCNFAILSVAHFTLQFFHFFLRIHCEYINARQGLWTDGAGGGGEFSLLGHSRMPNC